MQLQEALNNFLNFVEAQSDSDRNVGSYRGRLGFFQAYLDERGIVDLEQIGPEEVDDYIVSLRRTTVLYANHPTRPPVEGKLSQVTIAGRMQAFKYFLKFCALRGYIERSPAEHVKVPRTSRSARNRKMDREDLDLLLDVAREKGNPRDVALLSFIADTGCRRSEVIGLEVSNLCFDDLSAWINGKNDIEDEDRLVEYSVDAARALKRWLAVRPDVDHDYVFVSQSTKESERGQPLTGEGLYQVFRRLAIKAKVTGKYNPHALRHLVGQHYTDNANLEIARQKLGHKHISTTSGTYAHQNRERVKAATARYSLLGGNDKK